MMKRLLPAIFIFFSLLGQVFAKDSVYYIDLTKHQRRFVDVTYNVTPSKLGKFEFSMPTWRTGKYKILDTAATMTDLSVSQNGKELVLTRLDNQSWQVTLDNSARLSIRYRVFADDLALRLRHVDDTHAFIDASGVMIYSPAHRHQPLIVNLTLPETWRAVSGMPFGQNKQQFVAENYDVLLDSPIEAGIFSQHFWQQEGKQYELVIWGEGNYDVEKIIADTKKLTPTSSAIWDDKPYQRYVIMVHATDNVKGATEHLNSTIIQRPRFQFAKREDYVQFMATVAHEYIHTWNVKAYRPKTMVPYDYQNEAITDLLWLSEGSTSYFQMPLMLRADILKFDEFSKDLAKRFTEHLNQPGTNEQSVKQGSEEAWISGFGHFDHNHGVNIYNQGYLASLLMDLEMIKRSNGSKSYRDVHRQLYNQFAHIGFDSQDVINIASKALGEDFSPWWRANIESPFKLEPAKLLNLVGLEWQRPEKAKSVNKLAVKFKKGTLQVSHVTDHTSAMQAGLINGDEIIAIDGFKVTAAKFNERLQYGNKEITLSLFRNGKLIEVPVTLEQKFDKPHQIKPMENPTEQQKALFKAWLGIDFPSKKSS